MKISKKKVQKIIQEELEMAYSGPKMDRSSHSVERDLEGKMAKNQLLKIAKYALGLHIALEDNQELESWVQNKITLADDYVSKVKHYLENELQVDIPEPDMEKAMESAAEEAEEPKDENYAGQGSYYYEV